MHYIFKDKLHFSVSFYQLKKEERIITYFLDNMIETEKKQTYNTVMQYVRQAYKNYDLFFPKQFSIFMKFWKLELYETRFYGEKRYPTGIYRFVIRKNGKEFFNFSISY